MDNINSTLDQAGQTQAFNPALKGAFDQVYNAFGGQNMSAGQQVGFGQVTQDLGLSPVQVALEMAKKTSADAVNSSLESVPDFSSPISGQSAKLQPKSLKGYPITQQFGNKSGVEVFSHGVNTGVDIGVPKNTPIALPEGTWKVVSAFSGAKNGYVGDNENSGYGNSVLVRNIDTGETLRFSHLNSVNLPSDTLKGGDVIGLSGRTGNTTGNHLDLEYKNSNGQLGDFLQTNYAKSLGL